MNRTDFANAPRNKKLSLTDEYRGTQEFKIKNRVEYDLVGQMPKKLQRKFAKELKKSERKSLKRIVISTDNGKLSIYAREIVYNKVRNLG